jgi:hypothetical protein
MEGMPHDWVDKLTDGQVRELAPIFIDWLKFHLDNNARPPLIVRGGVSRTFFTYGPEGEL